MLFFFVSLLLFLSWSKPLLNGTYTSSSTHQITISNDITSSYIYIELYNYSPEIPLLSANIGSSPDIKWNPLTSNWNCDASYIDWNSWIFNKSYHHLLLQPLGNFITGKTAYITVSFHTNISILYSLYINSYNTPVCPHSCNNKGSCKLGKCICDDGYGDDDCSLSLIELELKKAYGIIAINKYKYTEIDDVKGDYLECRFFKYDNGNVTAFFKNERDGISNLPTVKDYSKACDINKVNVETVCEFSLANYNSSKWYISMILNEIDSSAMVSVLCNTQEKQRSLWTLLWVLLSLGVLLIGIIIAVIVIRKLRKKSQVLPSLEPRIPDPNERQKLNEKFPCLSYEDLKLKNEEKCSICQESFVSTSKVRKLECQHIFHQICIDVWFDTSSFCPLCKKDYKPLLEQFERTHTDVSGLSINLDVSERTWLTQ